MNRLHHRALSLFALIALAPLAAADDDFVETFDGGVNTGGWTYGPPPIVPPGGGNPGAYLLASVDTFAPQVRTTGAGGDFTGDYRARDVVEVGVDVIVHSTQFPALRELTLMLSNSAGCQVYFLGTEFVPQPGTGWERFHFDIPSQSSTLPPGWFVNVACGSADATWNAVITDVTEVRFFYGDPTFFFIFDIWDTGIDNARIVCDPWTDLGSGLAGTHGEPVLTGTGSMSPGSQVSLELDNALENTTFTLVVGLSALNAPFKGGTMVPALDTLVFGLPTGPLGTLTLSATWPSALPSGFTTIYQAWVDDAAGPVGFAASNAQQGVTP